ncbi:DNA helicase/exodeoxyribonuclease V gamma subunit [Cricetibacter osteomyelitidis]|uniref:RecBCD enzyme subunit RecC n=1 Tax=Cricetibacter osteomyelitidis TaxID=1521931 RepID=A0A4R2SYR0_9PAST|nr:exodeoxyribonuclease V subunit gamma [Cricetibacter osteomyelitidis]TCP89768.1 DNA helicase/exodeoxyribonuclease V gamma subunit [Cricetibacter osteomyelitidis]
MLTIYHSNQVEIHKELLIHLMEVDPLTDPFESEVILVQSPGMAQWLQIQIAEKKGISANLKFPMPASFIWQQYNSNLPDVPAQSEFAKDTMVWRLMALIPHYLEREEFQSLAGYLRKNEQSQQHKLYHLACKIADLFDQYLVYRPDWIKYWEQNQPHFIESQIKQCLPPHSNDTLFAQIHQDIAWQGVLWQALVSDVLQSIGKTEPRHRTNLHLQYLNQLKNGKAKNLPKRLFIFGISALPKVYLETFHAMSKHCDVHLFFNNPCRAYWGDIVDERYLQKLVSRHRTDYYSHEISPLISDEQQNLFNTEQYELTADDEKLQIGNPLLATWGKLGRDFLHLLTEMEPNEIAAYAENQRDGLLQQVQNRILDLVPQSAENPLNWQKNDRTLTFHSCHSPMREVEILHDHLLQLFQQNPELTPKDIVVMVADIDQYAPYIQAVFGQYQAPKEHFKGDPQHIPYSISDSKLTANDVLVEGFLSLLKLKESLFGAEDVLAFLDIPAIRERFAIEADELPRIRSWVAQAGIRFGLEKTQQHHNYNAWKAGLERMLLGYAMREQNGIWQDNVGFDASYGLKGQLTGSLAEFIEQLYQWQLVLQQNHNIQQWCEQLLSLVDQCFAENSQNTITLLKIKESINELREIPFKELIESDVIADVLTAKLSDTQNSLKFLVGRVSFCTLLPMRAIPFKVICLLGMNDGSYPRQQTPNSFDLMHYHRQKGDRFRRDDDRYLFLEALLSAREQLYISYVGKSIINNQKLEPSVLVSQLLTYLTDNSNATTDDLIHNYSMTIFSAKNFDKNHRSFAKQWLPVLQGTEVKPFNQPIPAQSDETNVIDLQRLIEFVQHPVKFFFEKRLGVYFRNEQDLIADSENFTLDGLEKYQIRGELLKFSDAEWQDYFARLKVKGILPRAEFATVYADGLQTDIAVLKTTLADYLVQSAQSLTLDLPVDIDGRTVHLQGNIGQLYGELTQRIDWRVSNVRDKDRIQSWLYYLALQAHSESEIPPALFYDKNGKVTATKTLDKSTALEQLTRYMRDYLQGETQLQIVPNENIGKYLALIADESAVDFEQCLAHLEAIAEPYNRVPDLYWQRLLVQAELDFADINQRVKDWFGNM